MKKAFIVLSILLISSLRVMSQTENTAPPPLNDYTKGAEGIFYVIIPMDESFADTSIAEIETLIEQNGLSSMRVSKFKIEDVELR